MQAEGNEQAPRNKLMFRFFGLGEERITRDNIQECFYMTHIDNLPSILQNGLLSHRRIEKLNPGRRDVSNQDVQARRAVKVIERVDPEKRARSLHRFVNLYLNPHNAMLINVIHGQEGVVAQDRRNMCILRIRGEVLDRGDAILTDQNAATDGAQFFAAETYELDARRTVAMTDAEAVGYKSLKKNPHFQGLNDNAIAQLRKQTRQAEALLPYKIQPQYIFGLWVCDQVTSDIVAGIVRDSGRVDINVAANAGLFLPSQYSSLVNYPARAIDVMDDIEHELPSSDESDDDLTQGVVALRRGPG